MLEKKYVKVSINSKEEHSSKVDVLFFLRSVTVAQESILVKDVSYYHFIILSTYRYRRFHSGFNCMINFWFYFVCKRKKKKRKTKETK